MIALLIIGIVAAITVPTLISKHRKELVETRLKSAYSILANMFKSAEVDYGSFASWDMSEFGGRTEITSSDILLNQFLNKYIRPYLKISNDKLVSFKDFGYKKLIWPDGTDFYMTSARFLTLANGMTFWFGMNGLKLSSGARSVFYMRIFVDIDGPGKGPNTIGKDIFVFYQPFVKDFPLSMYGEQNINWCTYNSNNMAVTEQVIKDFTQQYKCTFMVDQNTGFIRYTNFKNTREQILENCKKGSSNTGSEQCGALIRIDGWKISKDYPWL